ncbi:hypothetical protein [Fredinandcohnia sp. 179-A 10B2 NHS]|uniref:hypothetical protein n=1 Tax=Fredinandcohnia sp. 179-A 10B2 NHS TaxID=3235176 RepID=UPI0039A12C76
MKQVFVWVFFIMLLIVGCEDRTDSIPSNMPDDMPHDFNFSLNFGVLGKNEINTYSGTVTKDLIENGTATAKVTFSNSELAAIYKKMKEINIVEEKKLIPNTACSQEPYSTDKWEITINGEIYTHVVSGQYCELTSDAEQLIQMRNFVFNFVKQKEEYRKLPEAVGGYE